MLDETSDRSGQYHDCGSLSRMWGCPCCHTVSLAPGIRAIENELFILIGVRVSPDSVATVEISADKGVPGHLWKSMISTSTGGGLYKLQNCMGTHSFKCAPL